MERDTYLKSIRHESFIKDIWKILKVYFLTLIFFGIIIFGSYAVRPGDETFPIERLYLFLKVIGITVTVIYVFVIVNFRRYYRMD